jgi:DNA-binding XRE family transcriptional regulator
MSNARIGASPGKDGRSSGKEGGTEVSLDPFANPLAFFAAEMKRVRATLGMTQEQLAEAAGYAPATVAAIETCRLLPSEGFAQHIDKTLGADSHFERLQKLVQQTSVLPWFRDRIEVERKSAEIWEYEPYVVPGLLQTEDYTRVVAEATIPQLSDDDIERAVALRMTRQEVLEPEDGAQLWFIIEESAVYRMVGSPEIMHAQHEHLLSATKRPNVTIQIIPSREGPTCAFGRAFTLLISRQNSSVIYYEDVGSARYVRDRHEVNRLMLVFNHLRASALDHNRSGKLIKEVAAK